MAGKDMTRRQFVRDTAAVAAVAAAGAAVARAAEPDKAKTLNYNENMQYRRWGKADLMISAICLGGHWKRINEVVPDLFKGGKWLSADVNNAGFAKNRHDVVSRCIELGINYIDACTHKETLTYSRALKGRRDKMYLGYSWYEHEMRNGQYRTCEALIQSLDEGMKLCGLDYVDLWRITMHERSSRHPEAEVEQMMKALETAKKQGKARFVGFSSHDRDHIKWMIETYPKIVDAVVTPCTPETKAAPTHSLFDTMKKHGVGYFGIKPFASGSLFKSGGSPNSAEPEEDDKRAREALRKVLETDALTAPIPGMITTQQVDNAALAIKERKQALTPAERRHLDHAMAEAWQKMPPEYQWLKEWKCV